jgi:hypothetical protein
MVDGDDEQFATPTSVDHTLENLDIIAPDRAAAPDDSAPNVRWWADSYFGWDFGRNSSLQDDVI